MLCKMLMLDRDWETDDEWLNYFYSADNTLTKDEVYDRYQGNNFTDNTNFTQRFGYLKNGSWLVGKGTSWAASALATSWDDMRYPDRTFSFINTSELGGDELAVTSSIVMKGSTPVGNHVA